MQQKDLPGQNLVMAAEAPSRSVDRVHAESARMRRLVDDLLLAQVDDQGLRVRRNNVDLDDLVYLELQRVVVQHLGLRIGGGVDPVRATGDLDQLNQVLRKLVDNAVTISLGVRDGQAEIVVGNDGPAIAAEDRERIFVRLDSRSRQGGGTGLGLAIARDIIAAHGGALTVDDLPEGAAMRVRLPLPEASSYSM